MIVDDNKKVRTMIQQVINNATATYFEFSDGHEAVENYAQCKPDLVLMDVKMQRMNGIEATKAIMKKDPRAKIVMVTQYDDPNLMESALVAGAIAYVTKDKLLEVRKIVHGDLLRLSADKI
ncbi:MAG: response regulator transcription factor [Ignavibacteriae bacterium]|nr:response regulator transcription factor [Ignavibacteriota bacterium]